LPTRRVKKVKGPLVFTAALFLATPLCMAEVAIASSSSFVRPDLSQFQPQTGLTKLQQTQPKTNQGSRLLSSSIPSLADINTLESTLVNLEDQLKVLKSQKPEVKPERLSQLEARIATLRTNISDAKQAHSSYTRASEALKEALKAKNNAQTAYELAVVAKATSDSSLTTKQAALAALEIIKASKTTSLVNLQEILNNAQLAANNADASLTEQKAVKAQAQTSLELRQEQYSTATANLNEAQQTFNEASSELEAAAEQLDTANQTLSQKQQVVNQAQQDYNTNLIPDPTWTAPTYQKENTRLVPYTEIQLVRTLVPTTTMIATGGVKAEVFNRQGYNNAPPLPTANEIPIHTTTVSTINFNWGSGNVLGSNRSEDVIVRFTANLLVPKDGFYQFYSPADDGTQLNIAGMNVTSDWYDKGGGGTISEPVWIRAGIFYPFTLHYYENGGGAAVGFYTYSPEQGFNVVPSTWMGSSAEQQTTYEEVITYEEVTKYREEIYYTTEPVLIEGTLNVEINEGGEATFTAPVGATFTSSSLRYEAKDNPRCGIDINPPVQGKTQIIISAHNSVWGDPCGGWYKHVTGTISYLGQPTAPLIKDPAKLATLNEALIDLDNASTFQEEKQVAYSSRLSTKNAANNSLEDSQVAYDEAQANKLEAEDTLESETLELNRLTTSNESAKAELITATNNTATGTEELTIATNNTTTASSEVAAAELEVSRTTNELVAATTTLSSLSSKLTTAETDEKSTASSASDLNLKALSQVTLTEQDFATASTDTVPLPEPPVEEGSKEIPAELNAENLLEVDLSAVDPTELTPAQAEQLVEAALETFLTAEEGSPAYEQALDALYLAAEQDDLVLSEELAAIPGLAGAVEVLNFLGNAGADMSPKVREESEKVVVATVIAAGAAIQAATGAATSAAVSASAPSGGGGSRRVGK
jgi:hypothetical protein